MSHSVLKYALKLRDKNRLDWLIESLLEQKGPKVVGEMMVQVIRELALESPQTFIWALQTLISPESLLTLGEVATGRCAIYLSKQGFLPGKDFEVHPEGGLMVFSPEVFNALLCGLPVTLQQVIKFD